MSFSDFLLPVEALTPALQSTWGRARERLSESLEQADSLAQASGQASPAESWLALDSERRYQLARVVTISDFALDTLARYPDWLQYLEASGELDTTPTVEKLRTWLAEALKDAEDEAGLHAVLRRFRRARMSGIVWRDLTRPPGTDMWSTATAVTQLAEVCLEAALGWLEQHLEARWGHPARRADGSEQRLVVLGMGKLGAGELNLSSDIDLIFAYPEQGETEGGRKALEHQEYFTRLGQKLIAALDPVTADGFAFRVDMRLRPLGEGGPLVGSFASLAAYYQNQGREWERYALLKARPVAGDLQAGSEMLDSLRPFIYRKYLDFGAIESLREMKSLINREVKRRGMQDNIKLGSGGIREVEFVVQAFQLIRGGRDTELQVTSLRAAMRCLPGLGLLPQEVIEELEPDYVFLRELEHVLQALEDRQTQSLPTHDSDRERVALALNMTDWTTVVARLDKVRSRVRRHFDAVIAEPEEEVEEASEEQGVHALSLDDWRSLWCAELEESEALAMLAEAGFGQTATSLRRLYTLRQSRHVQSMQRIGYERLEALMPLLLDAVAENAAPDMALERVLPLLEAVLRRTAYLALLRENPEALSHLMELCAASPWIAEQLARYPILLDELLTPETLYTPADKKCLADELRQVLGRIAEDDEEAQLEALRVFKHGHVLRVAASDIAGTRHLMKVSDYLTFIAEVVLDAVLAMAWRHLVRKHGYPLRRDGTRAGAEPEFLIVGYGKLGGIELGYGSDLDLVFLHAADPQAETDGARPIDTPLFFTRLGQRIIHLLTAVTPAGALYDVDMRLRPSGNAGLLVASLDAFSAYQRREAWTWEHQALVRARVVAGHADLALGFDAVRRETLGQRRNCEVLREEVSKMRQKMREHLGGKAGEGAFDLKHDLGGMVDIEFLCQFAVLSMGHETPELLQWSDNMRILDTLESSDRLTVDESQRLRAAYLALRSAAHRASLTGEMAYGRDIDFQSHRQAVLEVWQRLLGSPAHSLAR